MPQENQELTLTNRERFQATGVNQVGTFDEEEIVLETGIGTLILKGQGMHITHLDLAAGELVVEGTIAALEYSEQYSKKIRAKGKNIIDRLLK
jgi:sporulation protein YabP